MKTAWGTVAPAILVSMLLAGYGRAAVSLPADELGIQIRQGTLSWFSTTLSGVPPGYSVANKSYATWCVDVHGSDPTLENGGSHRGVLANEYPGMALDRILYVLNHKQGTVDDVQRAIWWFSSGLAPDPATHPVAVQIVADAEANGGGYSPGPHDIAAACIVWTSPNPAVQKCIIEVPGAPNIDTNAPGGGNGGPGGPGSPGGGNGGGGGGACSDRFTAGGFIYVNGSKANFGIQGGFKNGQLHGGINFIDHGTKMHVKSRTLTSYTAIDANCREAVYDCTIDGEPGTATVVVCDYGEPGRGDVVEITLSTGYTAGQGSTLGGGNVQLHTGGCGDAPKAKPSPKKGPKVKPGNSDDGNGNGNAGGNGKGKGKGKGGGNGKGKGKKG